MTYGRFVIRQYLLPDYPHEPALLECVASSFTDSDRLVTYNGRCFDVPLYVSRLTIHGLHASLASIPAQHDDLLPIARRLWARVLGSARLVSIESGVLGVQRASDCASAEVPSRYLAFLRDGCPAPLRSVVDHNAHDVLSLALLDAELARLRNGAWRTARTLDARGMALELLRLGQQAHALELLERAIGEAADPGEGLLLRRLASRFLLARGDPGRAEAIWRAATGRASIEAALAWHEVARIRERHARDVPGALAAAQAASRVLDITLALGRGGGLAAIGRTRVLVEGRVRRLARRAAAARRRAA